MNLIPVSSFLMLACEKMKTVRWLNYISVDSCKSKVKWHSNKSLCLIVKVHTMSSLSSADWFAIRE